MSKGVTVRISQELADLLDQDLPVQHTDANKERYNPEADPEFVASFLKLEFVDEIRNIMEGLDINASELARKIGKSRQAVSKALDKSDPDNFTIEKMAELVTALGARISIRVHEPGTTVVATPVHDSWKPKPDRSYWRMSKSSFEAKELGSAIYSPSSRGFTKLEEALDEESVAA